MAKIISMSIGKNSIDCILSGSIGNKVWVYNNGINYTRSKPSGVSKPRTTAQLEHSARFVAIIKFLQPLTHFLRVGFKDNKATMSPFNAAMGYNLKNAIVGIYPDYEIDYSKVLVSRGSLPGALCPEVKITTEGKMEFTWKNNSIASGARANDKVLLVAYNSSKREAVFIVGGNTRISGSQLMDLPSIFAGDEVYCYMAFQNMRQSVVSNSQFIPKYHK